MEGKVFSFLPKYLQNLKKSVKKRLGDAS